MPASIRPTVAAAMVRLADLKPNQTVLDPMCGAGTILAEAYLSTKGRKTSEGTSWPMRFVGGDIDAGHVRAAQANLRQFGISSPRPSGGEGLGVRGELIDIKGWESRELPIY